jgi:hypothetical protein
MERKARTILLNHVGWKARKHPAKGGVFFLTFPFIELPSAVIRLQSVPANS